MGKVGYRFLVVFFTWFGALIVFINFVGWSGAYVNVSSGGNVDWNNSYFGFESVSTMIRTLNITLNSIPFLSIKNFTIHLNDFLDTCAFGLPQMLGKVNTNGVDIVPLLKVLIMVLGGQPLLLVVRLFILVAHILYYAVNFVGVVLLALGGRFNIPFDNPLTPSDVVNTIRITVPVI